jgi:hypothetical protein
MIMKPTITQKIAPSILRRKKKMEQDSAQTPHQPAPREVNHTI